MLHRVYVRGRCAANRDVTENSLGAVNWIVRWEHGGVGAYDADVERRNSGSTPIQLGEVDVHARLKTRSLDRVVH